MGLVATDVHRTRFGTRLAVVVGSVLVAAIPACKQTDTAPDTGLVVTGGELFGRYCASCHGIEGTGDGPVAATLTTPPADLTALARRAGGKFDEQEVMSKIDGREEVAAHGPREMPVWGAIFEGDFPGQTRAFHLALLQTRALTEYVASIQKE